MARLHMTMRSPNTGMHPTTIFGFSYWMCPQAGQTARIIESPSGMRWVTGVPHTLQWLIKATAWYHKPLKSLQN
jgi:hypothetical protein